MCFIISWDACYWYMRGLNWGGSQEKEQGMACQARVSTG